MSEQKHTPGPWKVFETRHPHHLGGEHIERRIGTAWDHAQLKGPVGVVNMAYGIGATAADKAIRMVSISEPDAHLIAAAPDLLAALKEVAHHADDECGFMVSVRAAIAKAEGR